MKANSSAVMVISQQLDLVRMCFEIVSELKPLQQGTVMTRGAKCQGHLYVNTALGPNVAACQTSKVCLCSTALSKTQCLTR